jgi:hypothetical protein
MIVPPRLLDIGEDSAYHAEAFRVDPWSLHPMGRGTPLVDASEPYVASPSRQFWAFSSPFTGMIQLLRLSNLSAGAPFRVFPSTNSDETVEVVAWPTPTHLLATVSSNYVHEINWSSALMIDPASRRTLETVALDGLAVGEVATRQGGMAMLVVPNSWVGQARLVVMSANGAIRTVELPAIAGGDLGDGHGATPAIAQTANGTILVVAAGAPLIAAVNPVTMAVHVHRIPTLDSPHPPPAPVESSGTAEPGHSRIVWVWAVGSGRLLIELSTGHPARLPSMGGGVAIGMVYDRHYAQIVSTQTWRIVRTLPAISCQAPAEVILCTGRYRVSVYANTGRLRGRLPGMWSTVTGGWLFAGNGNGTKIVRYRLDTLQPVEHLHLPGPVVYELWPFDLLRTPELH